MNVIVTGADGALGSAVVHRFAQDGGKVAALQGDDAGVDPAKGQFAASDLSDERAAAMVMETAAQWLGRVDGFVHLAGGFVWRETSTATLADWRAMFDTNLATAVASVTGVLPHLAEGGAIVLVGAASAQPARAGFGPYGAAKAGVARLTEALSAELTPRRIRVNAVLPAIIDTPRNRADMPGADPAQWTCAEAVADVIAFLTSAQARAINGALLPVTNPA